MKLSNSFEIFNQPIYNYQFLFFVFKSQKMSRGFSWKKEVGARKNRALPETVGAKLPPPQRIFPNRPVTYYYVAWNARTKCRTPLTYVSRTYLCMYAHQAPGGLSTLSLSLLSSPPAQSLVVATRNSNLSFRRRWKSCGTWRRELTR